MTGTATTPARRFAPYRSRKALSSPVYAALYVGEAKMATSASATDAVSADSSVSDQSNRRGAYSARSTTTDGTAPSASATARATPWVREAGLGLPVTTAMRIAISSGGGDTRRRREWYLVDHGIIGQGKGRLPSPALAQQGQHTLAEPVRLLQVRVPGQDELRDAQVRVFEYPV